jgi:hypothetical protein
VYTVEVERRRNSAVSDTVNSSGSPFVSCLLYGMLFKSRSRASILISLDSIKSNGFFILLH